MEEAYERKARLAAMREAAMAQDSLVKSTMVGVDEIPLVAPFQDQGVDQDFAAAASRFNLYSDPLSGYTRQQSGNTKPSPNRVEETTSTSFQSQIPAPSQFLPTQNNGILPTPPYQSNFQHHSGPRDTPFHHPRGQFQSQRPQHFNHQQAFRPDFQHSRPRKFNSSSGDNRNSGTWRPHQTNRNTIESQTQGFFHKSMVEDPWRHLWNRVNAK